jgi:hypothetical protein
MSAIVGRQFRVIRRNNQCRGKSAPQFVDSLPGREQRNLEFARMNAIAMPDPDPVAYSESAILGCDLNRAYSFRSAISGSMLAERWAEIAAARTATNARLKTASSKDQDMPLNARRWTTPFYSTQPRSAITMAATAAVTICCSHASVLNPRKHSTMEILRSPSFSFRSTELLLS